MSKTTVTPMLNVRKDTPGDTFTLVIQILCGRRRGVIFTPYKLPSGEFDRRRGIAVTRRRGKRHRSRIEEINAYLSCQLDEIARIVAELERQGRPFDAPAIVRLYRERSDNRFARTFFRTQIEQLRREGKYGTAATYESALTAFCKFAGDRRYLLDELTPQTVLAFRRFLLREGLQGNTVTFYLSKLRALYNRAVQEGFAPKGADPFAGVSFRIEKTRKLAVGDDVLRLVARAELPERYARARDLFLFSFYCRGMSFVDMAYLRQEDIRGGAIYYRRRKTGQLFSVRILLPLQAIIDRYRELCAPRVLPILMFRDGDGRWRPYEYNAGEYPRREEYEQMLYERYRYYRSLYLHRLRTLSERLGLEERLTFNMARHTWASRARREGIGMAVISEGLGHTSEKTTRIYLEELESRRIDEANRIVTDF